MPVAKYWDGAQWVWASIGPAGPPGGSQWAQVIGDGAAKSFTITHSLSTRNVNVAVYRNFAPFDEVEVDVERTDLMTVTIRTDPYVPAVGELMAVISGAGSAVAFNVTMDSWHNVGAIGEPAFAGAWTNFGGGEANVGFRKLPDGRVVLRGLAKAGTTSPIFTLPLGYRPPAGNPSFACLAHNGSAYGIGQVYINAATGEVRPINSPFNYMAGGAAYVVLDEIEFDTESVLQTASVAAQPLDPWHVVGSAGEPVFSGGWVAYSVGATPRFRKYPDGRVRLVGAVKTGASGSTAFALPPGYRPTMDINYPVLMSGGTGYVVIYANGNVIPFWGTGFTGTGSAYTDLNLEWETETVAAYTTGTIGPPKVTSLPTNPIDGQECYYSFAQTVVPADAQPILWHLRYDSVVGKWIPVGDQQPVTAFDGTQRSQTFGVGWSQYTGAVLSAQVPLAGMYRAKYGAGHALDSSALANLYVGLTDSAGLFPSAGATSPTGGLSAAAGSGTSSTWSEAHGMNPRVTYAALQSAIWGCFTSVGQAVYMNNRYIELYPVQVG